MITSILMGLRALSGSDRKQDVDAAHRIVSEHPGIITEIDERSTYVRGVRTMVLTDAELERFKPMHDAVQAAISDMFSA